MLFVIIKTPTGENTGVTAKHKSSVSEYCRLLRLKGHEIELFLDNEFNLESFKVKNKKPFKILNTVNCDSSVDLMYSEIITKLRNVAGMKIRPLELVQSFCPIMTHLEKLYLLWLDLENKFYAIPTKFIDAKEKSVQITEFGKSYNRYFSYLALSGIKLEENYVIKIPFSSTSRGVYILKASKTLEEFFSKLDALSLWIEREIRGRRFFYIQKFFPHIAELRCYFLNGEFYSLVATKPDLEKTEEERNAENDNDIIEIKNSGTILTNGEVDMTAYSQKEAIDTKIIVDFNDTVLKIKSYVKNINEVLVKYKPEHYEGIESWPMVRYDFFIGAPNKSGKQKLVFNEFELGSADLYPSNNEKPIIEDVINNVLNFLEIS